MNYQELHNLYSNEDRNSAIWVITDTYRIGRVYFPSNTSPEWYITYSDFTGEYLPVDRFNLLSESDIRRMEHIDKYLTHVRRIGISFDESSMLDDIVFCLKQGDFHLNKIPLYRWDSFHGWYRNKTSGAWSLSDTVCTAKCAALVSGIRVILGDDTFLHTGQYVLAAWKRIQEVK